jgi:hypothetical protein
MNQQFYRDLKPYVHILKKVLIDKKVKICIKENIRNCDSANADVPLNTIKAKNYSIGRIVEVVQDNSFPILVRLESSTWYWAISDLEFIN